jgi:UDP-glucuronate 4-epimerase
MNSPILVTGAAGFIGSHLAQKLVHSGCEVVALDSFDDYYPVSIKRNNIQSLLKEENFHLIEGDIRDSFLLKDIFSRNNFRAVVHLAARAGVRPSIENPLLYQDVNIMGTLNLLQECRNASVEKFIFASSSSVYGANCPSPFDEDANVNYPVSPYAASKASTELFCRTYNHLYKLPVIILRLFTVYGPRQRPEMAIHHFVKQIEDNEEIVIFGDGSSNRDYTYVDDIVDGFAAALEYHGPSFQIFNLGRGQTVKLDYLVKIIEKALNKKSRIKYAEPAPGDMLITIADISKARSLLGFDPKVSIEEGISRFVRWHLNNKES